LAVIVAPGFRKTQWMIPPELTEMDHKPFSVVDLVWGNFWRLFGIQLLTRTATIVI
jgi:hypothetical protein